MCIEIFNPVSAHAQINIPLPFAEELSIKDDTERNRSIIETDNELLKLITVFFIVDRLYPNEAINQDITGFMHRVWPTTKIEKLQKIAQYLKNLIMLKRRYSYVINRLKQKIKASAITFADAPIIAKDGEFAPKFSDKRKEAESNNYKISYIPYKYIGYDNGEYGDPVRRRDKNYEPTSSSVIDEITLALLQFNISAFYRALKKLPQQNDGSREKSVELADNIRTRLIMDTAALGSKEEIHGFMEVYVPQGLYINGDFINPKVKPLFTINENTKTETNIKDYQIYYPLAFGVENNNKASRILVETVRFPLRITRSDLHKDININSTFTFQVCQAKTKNCRPIVSHNSLTINASTDTMTSIHSNAVQIAFSRLPPEKSRNASVKAAYYNPLDKTLTIKFKTAKNFSNVAAMAEDAAETNFLKPQYKIEKGEITATFHTKLSSVNDNETSPKNIENGGEIAITAAFDEYDVLRTVITPKITAFTQQQTSPSYVSFFLLAVLLSFMPGLFYLLQRLLTLFMTYPQRQAILHRYAIGSFIGIVLWAIYNRTHIFAQIYENSWIMASTTLLMVSYLMHSFNYVDFELFRPLRGKIKRGFFIGLFSVLLAATLPLPLKDNLFYKMNNLPPTGYINCWFIMWLGLLLMPTICYIFRNKVIFLPLKMHYLNRALNLIYLVIIAIIIFQTRGLLGFIIISIFALLMAFIWYIYPKAIDAAISHKRTQANKQIVFDKVQIHAAIITTVIWLSCGIIFSLLPIKDQSVPNIETISNQAQQQIKEDKALLFVLNAAWSPLSWFNQIHLSGLTKDKIQIKSYTPSVTNSNALQWYQKYQKDTAPLHILFTSRHPRGISLPINLRTIKWKESLAYFINQPKEEKDKK